MSQKPSIGRIVHVSGSGHEMGRPAVAGMITAEYGTDMVDITIFPPGQQPIPLFSVSYSENEGSGMRWFWPPRV